MNVFEAFRALEALNEDTFSINDDGIKKLSDFENQDDLQDDISVIDPEAETEEDIKDSYVGKVILDCSVCHSKLYKDKEEIKVDEEEALANIGEECPYCYTSDGFKVIGEVAPFSEEEAEEDIEETEEVDEPEDDDSKKKEESLKEDWKSFLRSKKRKNKEIKEDLGADLEKYQDWVDYDMKRYGKISEQTNKEIKEAGLKIVKDKYGDYEVISGDKKELDELLDISVPISANVTANGNSVGAAGGIAGSTGVTEEFDEDEELQEGIFDKLKKDKTMYTVWQEKDGQTRPLITVEGEKEAKKSIQEYTKSHGSDYVKQHSIKYTYEVQDTDKENKAKAEYRKYRQSLGESINNLSLDTEDTHMEMTSDDNGKVTITTEPVENQGLAGEQVIKPLSDETELEIEANSEAEKEPVDDEAIYEEEPTEGEEIDMEIEDFDEESFDAANESLLRSSYSNVECYRTTNVSSSGNKLFVEGLITFTNGNVKKTSFILESKEMTKAGKASFNLTNKQLKESYKTNLVGNLKNNKFITESIN